jgi:iron complex outermembrane receptor protein
VIVQAQRRSESLQKVPIAVTVLSNSELLADNITQVSQLSGAIPNLNIMVGAGVLNPFLRGVGTVDGNPNSEQSVAFYVDGVYYASPHATSIFGLANIQQVEVLKGPQGTLFGRNATAGVIQILTRDPTQTPTYEASIGYGNYNTVSATTYLSGGLSEHLAADLSAYYENNLDGYGNNFATGTKTYTHDNIGLRSKWVATLSDTASITFTADYSHTISSTDAWQTPEGQVNLADIIAGINRPYVGQYNSDNSIAPVDDVVEKGASLRYTQDFSAARFVSISAYRNDDSYFTIDGDTTPTVFADLGFRALVSTWSQEFQLMNEAGSPFDWTVGAYYFHSTPSNSPETVAGAAAFSLDGGTSALAQTYAKQTTDSASLYAQSSFQIADKTKATLGARFTEEFQKVVGWRDSSDELFTDYPEQKQSFRQPTYRVAVDRELSDNVDGYVSFNRGLRSGGFNMTQPDANPYKPEFLTAYEIGVKSELFDHRVRLNGAFFFYDYKDIATEVVINTTNLELNAGAAHMYGFDGDFQVAVTDKLTLRGGLGLLSAKYTDYADAPINGPSGGLTLIPNAKGYRVLESPPVTASLSADYRIPTSFGALYMNGSAVYTGDANNTLDGRLKVAAHTLVNAKLGCELSQRFSVELWGKNLNDARYYARALNTGLGDLTTWADPRTYGVRFFAHF